MRSLYEQKKTLSVFLTTPKCPLSFKGRLVLSYLAYQDEYCLKSGTPSTKKIIKATVLGEKSVGSALMELGEHGLFDRDGRVLEPPGEWFFRKKESAGHWHHQYIYWRMVVRSPDSPLTHSESAIYAFFLHCGSTGYRPKWTAWYFRAILGIDHHTAKRAIEHLITRGLIEEGNGGNLSVIIKSEWEAWWQEPSPHVPEMNEVPTITLKVVETPFVPKPTKYHSAAELRAWIKPMVPKWTPEQIDALVELLARTPNRTEETDLRIRNRLNWPTAHFPDVMKYAEAEC
ncbi:MAG: hypothetical protein ACLQNE_38940 [Thermoguttaceae bacterium]